MSRAPLKSKKIHKMCMGKLHFLGTLRRSKSGRTTYIINPERVKRIVKDGNLALCGGEVALCRSYEPDIIHIEVEGRVYEIDFDEFEEQCFATELSEITEQLIFKINR